jgi:hypothetical protein
MTILTTEIHESYSNSLKYVLSRVQQRKLARPYSAFSCMRNTPVIMSPVNLQGHPRNRCVKPEFSRQAMRLFSRQLCPITMERISPSFQCEGGKP